MLTLVLFQPQIPQNTGNIVRTADVMGCSVILIPPLGFSINDRWLKRAGLDYWDDVNIREEADFEKVIAEAPANVYFYTSHAKTPIHEKVYTNNDYLVFGSETGGLPQWVHQNYPQQCLTIPMKEGSRCLNLATSVGIGVYEARRQLIPIMENKFINCM